MPEKWYIINGKFTEEEVMLIEQYLKNRKISKNMLVRNAIGVLVPIDGIQDKKSDNSLRPIMRDFFNGITKIGDTPYYKRKVYQVYVGLLKKYPPEKIEAFSKFFESIETDLELFKKKHAPVGRPKTKRNRGRPKKS